VSPRALALIALVAGASGCSPHPQAYRGEPIQAGLRVAVVPFSNYTGDRDAPDQVLPLILVELARLPGVSVVEPGKVEAVLDQEPWLLFDRIPPDLVDRFGEEMEADALLVGSILAYGQRDGAVGPVPEVSVACRLLEVPGGKILWSVVHSRDGEDGESVFGLGREESLNRLAREAVRETLETFPPPDTKETP
jgi:TolB-like protein